MIGMASVIAVTLSARNVPGCVMRVCRATFARAARLPDFGRPWPSAGLLLPAKRDSSKQNWSKRNTPKCN